MCLAWGTLVLLSKALYFVHLIIWSFNINHWTLLHSNLCLHCISFLTFFKIPMYLTCTLTHSCRSSSTLDLVANDSTISDYNFECPINQAEDEGEEDCEIPWELARLLLQEEKIFIRTKSQLKSSIWVPRQTRKKSRSALTWKSVSREGWLRCCMTMWKYLLGRMKIF